MNGNLKMSKEVESFYISILRVAVLDDDGFKSELEFIIKNYNFRKLAHTSDAYTLRKLLQF